MTAAMRRGRDREHLRSAFYQAFDRSWVEHILAFNIQELGSRHEFIGEGSHFTAWRLKSIYRMPVVPKKQSVDLSLVIKRPHQGFVRPNSVGFRRWMQGLKRLQFDSGGAGMELVPPLEWVESDSGGALVMPYGDAPMSTAHDHWEPMSDRWTELHSGVARRGLELAGVDQGRAWQGIPFVIDLSDLRFPDDAGSRLRY